MVISQDISSSLPVFHQAVLSCMTKPVPVVAAVISLISYFPSLVCTSSLLNLNVIMLEC